MSRQHPAQPLQASLLPDAPPLRPDISDEALRHYFNRRWLRWHPAGSFDRAVQDPVTRRLLVLAVSHLPRNWTD